MIKFPIGKYENLDDKGGLTQPSPLSQFKNGWNPVVSKYYINADILYKAAVTIAFPMVPVKIGILVVAKDFSHGFRQKDFHPGSVIMKRIAKLKGGKK